MGGFTHLHLHTTYSLLDGQCGIVPLVAKAKALGMTSLAVTDHGNMFAAKAFYDEARKQGIKPILGVEAYIVDHDHRERHEFFRQHKELKEKRFHLCLHAKNLVGYHNLVRLVSEAHINGYYYLTANTKQIFFIFHAIYTVVIFESRINTQLCTVF